MSESLQIPVIDLRRYLAGPSDAADEDCRLVAGSLERLGVVVVRDDRLNADLNASFHQMMVSYFNQPEEAKGRDERADLDHQIGWTPPFTEQPRNRDEAIAQLPAKQRPRPVKGRDPKERYFKPVGVQPPQTKYRWLNERPPAPAGFPEWEKITDEWGAGMLRAILTTCEMAARGLGANTVSFTRRMTYGPHLLAPTGSDLIKYGETDRVLAGFHNDLNLLTGHAQANLPGLFAWTRQKQRFAVEVPKGCLLMQAGAQLEYLTGGRVLAGFHEVAVTEEMQPTIEAARQAGRPLWRVSSTLFAHASSDEVLEPIGPFGSEAACLRYPPLEAGEQVAKEIEAIGLADGRK